MIFEKLHVQSVLSGQRSNVKCNTPAFSSFHQLRSLPTMKLNMRTTVGFLLLGLLLLDYFYTLECKRWKRNVDETCHDADVLIFGAGMAGITAGYTLGNNDNGTNNFIILEAGEEIGGRVKSKVLEKSGARIELGANWMHGIDPLQPEKHPLYSIAQECGGVQGFFMHTEFNTSFHFYNSSGAEITTSSELQLRIKDWYAVEEKLASESLRRTKLGLPDISVRKALEENNWIPQSPVDSVIEWMGIDFDYSYTPENTSLMENFPEPTYRDFGDPSRVMDFFVTDQKVGYAGVVQCVADRYLTSNDSRLHLQSVVKEIVWNDTCVCATTTEAGTLRRYCAPYAIATFSIGVLRAKTVKFTPDLPQEKQNAINNLYDALYLKIFLEFEETFWQTDVNYIFHADPDRGHFFHFQSLSQDLPGSNILMATVTGRWATAVYNQTTDATKSQIMQVLRKVYGSQIPDPVGVTIPDWGINPFYMGMYSDFPPGYEHLREDLVSHAGRVYFGGEATNDKYSAYVHGAYFSGIDAANQVIYSLRNDD